MVLIRTSLAAMSVMALALLTGACSSSGGNTTGSGGTTTASTTTASTGGAGTGGASTGTGGRPSDPVVKPDLQGRTYDIFVPTNLDPTKPAPLLFEIHGFLDAAASTTPGPDEETRNHLQPEADKRGVILVLPKGSVDPILDHYVWSATDACCGWDIPGVDDVGYLMGIIEDVKKTHLVDDKRIFVFGHSGGGFMANRLACDQADKIAAVVSLAGETWLDQSNCAASAPIAYLQVQGDADATVPYAGGPPYGVAAIPNAPGAIQTTQDWAKKNRCDIKADTSQPPIDIVADLDGAETVKLVYKNCEGNGATELWTIHLGVHSPNFNMNWAPAVLDFMMAHPRP
jgi:polyhydroxybutyrate depolymerase